MNPKMAAGEGETNLFTRFPECCEAGEQTAHERVRDSGPVSEGLHHQGQRNRAQEGLQTPTALPSPGPGGQPQSPGCGARTGHGKTTTHVHIGHWAFLCPLFIICHDISPLHSSIVAVTRSESFVSYF